MTVILKKVNYFDFTQRSELTFVSSNRCFFPNPFSSVKNVEMFAFMPNIVCNIFKIKILSSQLLKVWLIALL